jgi:hypothetical protein
VTCSSSHRCRLTFCNNCRWRYSGQIARRIPPDARRFFAVEIEIADNGFRAWASSIRNVIEYRRSQSRWWNEVSLKLYLCRDQKARGIIALGSILESELVEAFQRWPTMLRPLAPELVREEVYRILHPARIAVVPNGRRYQSISFSIGPREPKRLVQPHRGEVTHSVEIVPMPCIF